MKELQMALSTSSLCPIKHEVLVVVAANLVLAALTSCPLVQFWVVGCRFWLLGVGSVGGNCLLLVAGCRRVLTVDCVLLLRTHCHVLDVMYGPVLLYVVV
jgi:hypothetical protein